MKRVVVLLAVVAATACSDRKKDTQPVAASVAEAPLPETASPFDALPQGVRDTMNKPFTGDLDALMKRRSIRVAVQMYKYGKVLRSSIVYSLPLRTDRVLSWRLTVPLKQRWQWHIWS